MKKRVMTLFLALVMCLAMLPTAALAANSDNEMAYVVHLTQYSLAGADEATRTSIQNGIYNLLFQAQFCPTEGPTVDGISATFTGTKDELKKWYPQNKDPNASSVTDAVLGTVKLGTAGSGCVAYARFVTNYIYNTLGTQIKFNKYSDKWAVNNVKSFIQGYANPGVYMYYTWNQGTTGKTGGHAVAFLGEDAAQNGFYCLSYGGGASRSVGTNHTLEIRYYTYDNFANKQVQANSLFIQQLQGGVYSRGTARPLNRSIQRIGGTTTNNATITDGTYTLTPACAPNARLDVAGGSQANLANVQIYTDNGSNAQKWDIASLGNGYYKLTAKCSGRVLDAYYNNISSGQNIIQYPWDGGNYQQWKFMDAGNGYYYIIPRCNENLCLDVYSAYSSDGTNVQVYTANQSNAQKWKLTPVDATTGQTTPAQTTPVQTTPAQTTTRTEYRYGRYVYTDYRLHTCWCQTYMTKLFGGATLQYSDWSTTRYSPTGKGWSCGTCRGNHIGVDHYTNGKPWWAEYSLPDGDYFWEETRTVVVQN